MTVPVCIGDGHLGREQCAAVTTDGATRVTVMPRNASDETNEQLTRVKYFSDYARAESGSPNMAVDGSVNPVEFFVKGAEGDLISVREMRFIFHGEQLNMENVEGRRFGPAAGTGGLTNGLRAFITQGTIETDLLVEPVKHMAEFFSYVDFIFNKLDAIDAGVDLLTWVLDFKLLVPIALPAGGVDSVKIVVRDDLTPFTFFQVLAKGQKEPGRRAKL